VVDKQEAMLSQRGRATQSFIISYFGFRFTSAYN